MLVAGWIVGAYLLAVQAPRLRGFGFDAFAYWNVSMPEPYAIPVGLPGSFNYAPPVALVFDWFSVLDWATFLWLWTALLVGTVIWMGWSPLGIGIAFAIPFVALELYHGNIHILLAAAIVLGFRHPWTWSFVLLTKPTAGVGLLWFVARREWRELGIALGATAVLCLASLLVAPGLWADWFDHLVANLEVPAWRTSIPVPLWVRLPLAAALVIWGARSDRRWTVVVASMVAVPVLWFATLAMVIGVIPEWRRRSATSAGYPAGR